MAITISGTNGIVGAGFTVDNSGVSVTAGVGTFGTLAAPAAGLTGALPALSAASLTSVPAANIVGLATAGFNRSGGFGKILQVISTSSTTQVQYTSTSFVVTNLTVNITPSSASSKIFITSHMMLYKSGQSAYAIPSIYRDSTNLGSASYGFGEFSNLGGAGGTMIAPQHLDSPNTTSQVTYAIYIKVNSGHNVYLCSNSTVANITVMEVAA